MAAHDTHVNSHHVDLSPQIGGTASYSAEHSGGQHA